MPIKRRAEGSYQVTVGHGGRTLRRSSRHWTYADARKVEADLLAQVRAIASGEKPDRKLSEGLEKWLTEHAPKLRSHRKCINHARMLYPYLKGRRISQAPQVWADVKAGMPGKAHATINHKGRLLRQVCNLAFTEWGWTDVPVGKRIKLLKETPREIFLTNAQVEALSQAAGGHAGDLILLAAYTGVRYGHLMRVNAETDVFEGRTGKVLRLDRTSKSRELQEIPLHPRVEAIAERLPLPISEWQLRQAWKFARAATGLQRARWHDLRHTCASWLVQKGVPLAVVKEILGHSTIAVTERYAHFAKDNLREAVMRLS